MRAATWYPSFIIPRIRSWGPLQNRYLRYLIQPTSQQKLSGLLPLALLLYGLIMSGSRRMALPWLGLLLAFLVLVLGSTLSVNGVVLENIKLPKHYLNRLFPSVFANFFRLELFMTGAWLPLAVLACLGLKALCERHQVLARPGFILALIAIVAFEYSSPIFRYSGRGETTSARNVLPTSIGWGSKRKAI